MWAGKRALVIVAVLALTAAPASTEPEPQVEACGPVEARSFLGNELRAPAPGEKALQQYEAAKLEWEQDPKSADATIWFGRRAAYLGRYREALRIFSLGSALHPHDARIFRHRGHRYITTRQLERAIHDLERAAELEHGREDRIEPDGLPNALNIPVSTLHTNIWYHLGLARYLAGDLGEAESAYRQGLAASTNDDMLVATTHWLYMTLRLLGREEEAAQALVPISLEMEIFENHAYHRLCLFYQGEIDEEDLVNRDEGSIMSAATAYGLGNWHRYNGRLEKAQKIFSQLLGREQWAAFGVIAAEADLARGLR